MPPARKKKPAARAKAKPKPRVTPKPRASARATARKRVTRKAQPRARGNERPRVEIKRDDVEQPVRPVAVGAPPPALWETDVPAVEMQVSPLDRPLGKPEPAIVDKPLAELGVGAFATLLAGSVFLPWYHNGPASISGWSSGTWGPIIFFLALAALAIVGLRRARFAIAFPVESPLVVEAIGWVCVIGLILKRYFQPVSFGVKLPSDGWIFASLGCALGLALLAGMASSNTAFVLRPRWFSGRAGWIGASVLGVALAGGLSLGFTNTAVPTASPIRPAPQPSQIRGLPPCATRLHLPTPQRFTAYVGYESSTCIATWYTDFGLNQAYSRYTGALRAAGWTVTDGQATASARTGALRGRGCGTTSVAPGQVNGASSTIVEVVVFPCSATPSK